MQPTMGPLRIEKHTETGSKRTEKDIPYKWKPKKR